jgi:hypothetical protein
MKTTIIKSFFIITFAVHSSLYTQETTNNFEEREKALKEFIKQRLEKNTPLETMRSVLETIYHNTVEYREWRSVYSDLRRLYEKPEYHRCYPDACDEEFYSELEQCRNNHRKTYTENKATPEYRASNIMDRTAWENRKEKQKLLDSLTK